MTGLPIEFRGVNFDSIRAAICSVYFFKQDMSDEEFNECLKYVVPMQHNYENPIKAGSDDTWIQYWIDEDDRVTQDYTQDGENKTLKVSKISLRFLGVHAEQWAKAIHHLTQRQSVAEIFHFYCGATMDGCFEYVGKIVPINVDYFGVGNTTIGFDVTFYLRYNEVLSLPRAALEYISLAPGEVSIGS